MRPSRVLPFCLAIGLAAVVLAGCTPDPAPSGSSSPSRSPRPSPSATASSPDPSTSATASSGASPVSIPCTAVVSNQTVYDFNPIYSARKPVSVAAGSPAATVQADRGTVCQWVNTSSGATIDVAIGKYDSAALARIRDTAFTGGQATSGWGGDVGYFSVSGGVGTANALVGPYWVTTRGAEFLAPGDVDPFMTSAVSAAQQAG